MTDRRKELVEMWGPEIVAKCCRYWKLHYGDGRWGSCGICRNRPQHTRLTWDEIDKGEFNDYKS